MPPKFWQIVPTEAGFLQIESLFFQGRDNALGRYAFALRLLLDDDEHCLIDRRQERQ
jgi:hypothetical protein